MPDSETSVKPIDHYEFWYVTEQAASHELSVRGQFDQDDHSIRTERVRLLGNPVQKTLEQNESENPELPDVHLVAYRLAPMAGPPMTKHVRVTNQLSATPVDWFVTDRPVDPENFPLLVLLPAWKKLSNHNGPVPQGPQFVCYPVLPNAAPVNRSVRLVDQFSDQNVQHLVPRYLCVPVRTNYQPMWNDVEHLALYEYSSDVPPSASAAWTRDAIRKWDALKIGKSVMLGVPSKKEVLPD